MHADSPAPSSPGSLYSRPKPRPPRSAEQAAHVRRLNRRREYLDRNPDYLKSPEHELADPLLYDTLIRRFQTPAEREAEGRAKGYSRVLETSLLRGEAKLERIAASYVDGPQPPPQYRTGAAADPDPSSWGPSAGASDRDDNNDDDDDMEGGITGSGSSSSSKRETNFGVEAGIAPPPADRDEARERWLDFLRDRFVAGRDADFDYAAVDGDDEYDALERRDAEDAWFETEEPGWEDEGGERDDGDDGVSRRRERTGETGVQDF